MPRRREVPKRKILPDPKYKDQTIAKFINIMMLDGKKSISEKIMYGALDIIRERGKDDPVEVFNVALENVSPGVEVKSRRVGGATYQVPLEVDADRSESLGMRWIIGFARAKKGTPMHVALANEIKDAANNTGNSVRKRDDVHKMAQANRAFAHFRF